MVAGWTREQKDACLAETRTRALLQDLLSGALRADDGGELKRGAGRQTLFVSATIPQRQHFAKACAQRHWCREAPRRPAHVLVEASVLAHTFTLSLCRKVEGVVGCTRDH